MLLVVEAKYLLNTVGGTVATSTYTELSQMTFLLVMGYLMRRNILAYKAPPNNEGYDLICIHPNPRHQPTGEEVAQVRVQVKSRYATDCDRGFPLKEVSLEHLTS